MTGIAAGYMDAMHGLCVTCHRRKLEAEPERYRSDFADCGNCHRDIDGEQLRLMEPYNSGDKGRIVSRWGGQIGTNRRIDSGS